MGRFHAPRPAVNEETVAGAIRDTLAAFLEDCPAIQHVEVETGDYDWSTNGQLVGVVIDGQRFTLTLAKLP